MVSGQLEQSTAALVRMFLQSMQETWSLHWDNWKSGSGKWSEYRASFCNKQVSSLSTAPEVQHYVNYFLGMQFQAFIWPDLGALGADVLVQREVSWQLTTDDSLGASMFVIKNRSEGKSKGTKRKSEALNQIMLKNVILTVLMQQHTDTSGIHSR